MVYPVTKGDGIRQKSQMIPMSCGDRRPVSQPNTTASYVNVTPPGVRVPPSTSCSYLDLLLCPLEDPLPFWRQCRPAQVAELFPLIHDAEGMVDAGKCNSVVVRCASFVGVVLS